MSYGASVTRQRAPQPHKGTSPATSGQELGGREAHGLALAAQCPSQLPPCLQAPGPFREYLCPPPSLPQPPPVLTGWKRQLLTYLRPVLFGRKKLKPTLAALESVQFSRSVVSDSLRPRGPQHARPPCPSPTPRAYSNSCPSSDATQPSHPPLLPPSIFPSIRVFSNESVLHIRWPEYWSFSLSISPSSEYSGLISFRMDWLGLLEVQLPLKSLYQPHSSKASLK